MAIMNYVTPGLTKIDFEDSLFVTTELDRYENEDVKGYIESRGGVVKNSVTKTTNYLIYKDGEEETTKYKKALELVREKGLGITILSLKTFSDLLTMKEETANLSEILITDKKFVIAGSNSWKRSEVEKQIIKFGGIIGSPVTQDTDYLLYQQGDWETEDYAKALSMNQNGDSDIAVISFMTFGKLVTMKEETPFLSKIVLEGHTFVFTGKYEKYRAEIEMSEHVIKYGGTIENSVTEKTDYLVYQQGDWETENYSKALSMIRNGNPDITVLSFDTFVRLSRQALKTVELGTWSSEKDGTRRPIKWIVVKKESGKALLLSAYGIGKRPYNLVDKDVTWETCTLRKWLNQTFYNNAFTDEEKKRIRLTEVRNEDNSNTPGGSDTKDRVFLLSIREVKEWLTGIERRQGLWWWLRSPGVNSHLAAGIAGDDFSRYGDNVSRRNSVCPALWIELDSDI